jgi:hypothetical protein
MKRRKPGRPVTTGSKATTVVSFRLSANDRASAERAALERGMTVNRLARNALLDWLLQPKTYVSVG